MNKFLDVASKETYVLMPVVVSNLVVLSLEAFIHFQKNFIVCVCVCCILFAFYGIK